MNTSFSLTKMSEPGECQVCPSQKAVCNGGMNIGPAAGYWRKNKTSSEFISCLFKDACLGMLPPANNPIGDCMKGYKGILCADCDIGFTRNREYQCKQCSSKVWVVGRIFVIILVIVALVYFFLKCQEKTRYLHVYLRLLLTHIQTILIIAAFNFRWPENLQTFFDFSRALAQPFSSLLELDCLMTHSIPTQVRLFQGQVIFLACLPIIFGLLSFMIWKIKGR
jgi:hypothetical protein